MARGWLGLLSACACDRESGEFGPSYFRNAVIQADAILLLGDGRAPAPGAEHGRPLELLGPTFWKIDDNYLW